MKKGADGEKYTFRDANPLIDIYSMLQIEGSDNSRVDRNVMVGG